MIYRDTNISGLKCVLFECIVIVFQTSMKPHSMISKSYGSPDSLGGNRASKTLQN